MESPAVGGISSVRNEEDNVKLQDVNFEHAVKLTGYGRYHITLALVCGFSFLAAGFQNGINAYILPSVRCDLHLTSSEMGLINAVFLAGGLTGSFLWGVLADMVGRKPIIVAGMFADGIIMLISSSSQSLFTLIIFRFLNGFIVGGPSAIILAYMGEFHSEKIRAKTICYVGLFWTASWVLLPGVAWYIIPLPFRWQTESKSFTFNSWRLLVAVFSLPSLVSALFHSLYQESPRYLLAKGYRDQALQVLAQMYATNTGKQPDTYPVKSLESEEKAVDEVDNADKHSKSTSLVLAQLLTQSHSLFTLPTLKITLLTSALFFANMFGYYGLGLWLPELFHRFQQHSELHPDQMVSVCQLSPISALSNATTAGPDCSRGHTIDSTVFTSSLITGCAGLVGNVLSGFLAGRMRRRTMPTILMLSSSVCVVAIYFVSSATQNLIVSAAFQLFIGTCNLVYNSLVVDMFPPSVSGMGVSFAIMSGRLGAMVCNLVFGSLLDISCSVPIFLIAIISCGGGLLSFLIPNEPYSDPKLQQTQQQPSLPLETIVPSVCERTYL